MLSPVQKTPYIAFITIRSSCSTFESYNCYLKYYNDDITKSQTWKWTVFSYKQEEWNKLWWENKEINIYLFYDTRIKKNIILKSNK